MATITTPVDFTTKKVSPGRLLLGLKFHANARIGGEDTLSNPNYTALAEYIRALGHFMSLGAQQATPVDRNWITTQQPHEDMFRFFLDNGDVDPANLTGVDSIDQAYITFVAQPADTNTVTIDAGGVIGETEFEWDDGGGLAGSGVTVLIGANILESAQNLVNAINLNIGTDCQAFLIKPDEDAPEILLLGAALGENAVSIAETGDGLTVEAWD